MATTTLHAPASRRMPELDALRGLMLIGMTLTHLPTRASYYAYQPFGFVAWAEGFILLSAVLTGRVYGRALETGSLQTVVRKLWARAAKLYGYHLALLGIAFTVVAAIALRTQEPALLGLLDFYFARPATAVWTSALLVYCPPLLDILPMYIAFLIFTPLALYAGRRWGWRYILLPSAGLWLCAQFGLRETIYAYMVHLTGVDIPFQNLGAFNIYGWQILWALGLWMGTQSTKPQPAWLGSRWTLAGAAVVVATFIGLRYHLADGVFSHPIDQGGAALLFDKWHLGALRLLNAAALAAIFARFRSHVARYFAFSPLVLLGKSSLEVFTAHVPLCFAALALVGDGSAAPWPYQMSIITICLSGLYIVAYLRSRRKAQITAPYGVWRRTQPVE